MHIHLTKPLVFIDIETTGLNIATDRIVEIALLKVNVDNSTELLTKRVNPLIPIPNSVSIIHGIYEKDIINCPTFKELAPTFIKFIDNADFAGFNSNKFDIPLLAEELLRAEVDFDLDGRKLIDVQHIYHFMEPRNLAAAYKFYCNKSIENAHSADADVIATYEVFKGQLVKYEGVKQLDAKGNEYEPIVNDVSKLTNMYSKSKNADLVGRIIYNEKGVEVFSFGKHSGKSVIEVFKIEPGYYGWMMNSDFPLYTKKVITKIKLSMK